MQLKEILKGLSRPRILLNAANIARRRYSRNKDLKHLIGAQNPPKPELALKRLLRLEIVLEESRLMGNAAYNMKMHIHVMAALLQELYLYSKERQKLNQMRLVHFLCASPYRQEELHQ